MDKHTYELFQYLNMVGRVFLVHFIRMNETTKELYEIKGPERAVKLIFLTISTILFLFFAIYSYIISVIANKVEVISSITMPVLIVIALHNVIVIKDEHKTLLYIIESINTIERVLKTYNSELNSEFRKIMNYLNIVYGLLTIFIVPGLYYYTTSYELRYYAACMITCFLTGVITTYTASSLFFLARETSTLKRCIKEVHNKKVTMGYCYMCKKRFRKRYNYNCVLHQIRLGIACNILIGLF